MSKIKASEFSVYANDPKKHDNKNGPCKCGAWHKPTEFEKEIKLKIKSL